MRGYMILTLSISSQSANENGNLVNLCIPRRLFGDNFVFRGDADKKVFCLSDHIEDYGLKYEDYDYLKLEDEPIEVFLNMED